jgi:hypothetical protein
MSGGIDQLVDTYKGNPQPLAANLQQAQKQQPPGSIPADLEEAIALQKIAELRNAFAGQQAMQAGGAQPSIMDKLKQIVGGMQAQAQPPVMPGRSMMPQRPVMAASGGSIDQLMSNLGTNYAGGGIVAFSNGDEVVDEKLSETEAKDIERRMRERTAPTEKKETPSEYLRQMSNVLGFFGNLGSDAIKTLVSAPGYGFSSDSKPADKPTAAAVANDPETQKLINLAAARAQTSQNTNPVLQPAAAPTPPAPRPNAGIAGAAGAGGAGGTTQGAVDPNSLRSLTEKYIRGELGVSPESERDKTVDWTRKTLGLDALLAEKQGRIDSREKAIAAAQAARTPEWIKGLQALSKGPIRGGAGMVLGQLGAGTTEAREAYAAQDMKYKDELDRLRDVITDAKIKGNQELVKEGMAAYKEVDARRRAAATSATSLLNTDENVRARLQASKDAAASRSQIAAAQLEEKKSQNQQRQRNWVAEQERKWQETLNKNPDYKKLVDARSLQERLLYTSTDPKTQEKAQEAVDMYNEKIAKMMPTSSAGTVNIPPPPKDAVKRIG